MRYYFVFYKTECVGSLVYVTRYTIFSIYRYQIELFYNCVEREMISMKKSTILLESLVYLMKVWERFIASKGKDQFV